MEILNYIKQNVISIGKIKYYKNPLNVKTRFLRIAKKGRPFSCFFPHVNINNL